MRMHESVYYTFSESIDIILSVVRLFISPDYHIGLRAGFAHVRGAFDMPDFTVHGLLKVKLAVTRKK